MPSFFGLSFSSKSKQRKKAHRRAAAKPQTPKPISRTDIPHITYTHPPPDGSPTSDDLNDALPHTASSSLISMNTYATTLSADASVCRHTDLFNLAIEWPDHGEGGVLATHSLARVDDLNTRFRGPVPPLAILHLDGSTTTGGLLSDMDYDVPDQPLVRGPLVLGRFVGQGRIFSGFVATTDNWVPESGESEEEEGDKGVGGGKSGADTKGIFDDAEHDTSQPDDTPSGAYTSTTAPTTPTRPTTTTTLIVKFCTPKEHAWDTASVVEEVGREAWLMDTCLEGLQGSVVPRWHGVYYAWQSSHGGTATSEVLCAVLEHAGERLGREVIATMSEEDKHLITDKYQALHDAGVVHKGPGFKHWLVAEGAPISSLRLIDFGRSLIRPAQAAQAAVEDVELEGTWLHLGYSDEDWQEAANAEMVEVREILGMAG